ncbi:hypothetical protein HPT27_04195 [Permianibacter sp. IMCC34836]|uniref:hypothetical protein n=1 Tax=Permianibacter fluminis TaxID=2738515 RepID=UPI001556A330|nr:hypothetical protein [Permianibacter fluminis]NQD36214.1 hypothetical protein [Permianibacter fluminis]
MTKTIKMKSLFAVFLPLISTGSGATGYDDNDITTAAFASGYVGTLKGNADYCLSEVEGIADGAKDIAELLKPWLDGLTQFSAHPSAPDYIREMATDQLQRAIDGGKEAARTERHTAADCEKTFNVIRTENLGEQTLASFPQIIEDLKFASDFDDDDVELMLETNTYMVGYANLASNCSDKFPAIAPSLKERREKLTLWAKRAIAYFSHSKTPKHVREFYVESADLMKRRDENAISGYSNALACRAAVAYYFDEGLFDQHVATIGKYSYYFQE